MMGNLKIRAATEGHGKGIVRGRAESGHAGRCGHATEKDLRVRRHAAVVAIGEARPEQIIHFVRRSSRRQTGHLAIANVTDHPGPTIQIGCERASRTLAIGARGSLTWINPDVLILTGNLQAADLLSLRRGAREQSEPEQNEILTHPSL